MRQKLIKLFWRFVSNRFLLQEYLDHKLILDLHLYLDAEDESYVMDILQTYIIPEIERREL